MRWRGPDRHDRYERVQPQHQRFDERFDGRGRPDFRPQPQVVRRGYVNPYAQWHRGDRLPVGYRSPGYVVNDWHSRNLREPPHGYHWVRSGDDYVLAAIECVAHGAVLHSAPRSRVPKRAAVRCIEHHHVARIICSKQNAARRGHDPGKEIICRNRARALFAAGDHLGAERRRDQTPFRCRVRMGEATAERAAGADRMMRDVAHDDRVVEREHGIESAKAIGAGRDRQIVEC